MIRFFIMMAALFAALSRSEAAPATFARDVLPILSAKCVACHGANQAKGKLDVRTLATLLAGGESGPALIPGDRAHSPLWQRVAAGEMPPPDSKYSLTDSEKAVLKGWVTDTAEITASDPARQPPTKGNLISHELLFNTPAAPAAIPDERLWRLRPEAYQEFVRGIVKSQVEGLAPPFSLTSERGFKDYSALYLVDEATTDILVRNAERIVAAQTATELKDGKYEWKGSPRDLAPLFDPATSPTPGQIEAAFQAEFRLATTRSASAEEVKGLIALYERNLKVASRPAAARSALAAILLRPDCIFRFERGGPGGAMLPPRNLAFAISLALGDRREPGLLAAAEKGELSTRQQVEAHVRRLLADPKAEKPRLLRFFREYFDYDMAPDVFKDNPPDVIHRPRVLVQDTDRLILHILAEDKDVLKELLTTDLSFVNYSSGVNKKTKQLEVKQAEVAHPINDRGRKSVEAVYGIEPWNAAQPLHVPKDQRAGILTQPSWLVAYSTNFDNDPVRRGRWIRERLLGGSVPDLPIGVAAQVPDDHHRTLRDRLKLTRAAACWKCHDKMDDLGLPFEQYDHFGKYRTAELVLDPNGKELESDRSGKPVGPKFSGAPLDVSGLVAGSGDPALDGPVSSPVEMMHRFARSERVRQVFVRHAFRYFLGRNETLGDARALQDADRAYVASGGSFKALVVSLLTSDAFLLRQ